MKLMASVAVVAVGIYVGAFMTTEAEGDTIVPGSIDDPVVTKSYVDQKLGSQSGGMTAEDVQKLITEQLSANSSEVVVVTVPLGKTLIAKDGSEFVVRAGKAVAYSSDANGISDLTDGKDITNGKSVPNNHLILFPRGGRGVQPDPAQKNGLTVLVRGQYQLQ
ncbi:hypothetical protein HUB94_27105 (plasmid) [Paenibacillus cellulosilyticus]|nr:hypothetical protein HUB94_27105 [Paenibacillus cellulosilyticus]